MSTNGVSRDSNGLATKVWVRSKILDLAYAQSNNSNEVLAVKRNRKRWAWTFATIVSGTLDGGMVVKIHDDSSKYNGQTIKMSHDLLYTSESSSGKLKKNSSMPVKRSESTVSTGSVVSASSAVTVPASGGRKDNKERSKKVCNLYMANPTDGTGQSEDCLPPDDLQCLPQLHEPTVVNSLQKRYAKDLIYTSTGDQILIALNPFKAIKTSLPGDSGSDSKCDLYGEEVLEGYAALGEKEFQLGEDGKPSEDVVSKSLPPHVFHLADKAFRNMMSGIRSSGGSDGESTTKPNTNQSILVSGESGAGKTVTTKHVLRYLASLSQWRGEMNNQSLSPEERRSTTLRNTVKTPMTHLDSSRSSTRRPTVIRGTGLFPPGAPLNQALLPQAAFSYKRQQSLTPSDGEPIRDNRPSWLLGADVEIQIVEANPILEAFGNARTIRNDNSSRFGKYIELQFKPTGSLIGASIETYLLEKVRLVHTEEFERNYHIFYEIMDGASEEELREYLLEGYAPEDFKIINQSGVTDRRDGVLDQEEFDGLLESMALLQFDPSHIKSILRTAAACMHALNINFTAPTPDESDLDDDNPHLIPFLALLGIDRATLRDTLCSYEILIGGKDKQMRNQTKENAEKGLESFIKALYSAMFDHLVDHINKRITCKPSNSFKAASIGILDIFGFESFQRNSFEQLCINYCNEALQQQFNWVIFKTQKNEYDNEGIDSSFIKFPDNQDAIDMIDKSILGSLDDVSFAPSPNDDKFARALYLRMEQNPSSRFGATFLQKGKKLFVVNHYAGPVEYSVETFIEKNKDEIPRGTKDLLESSSESFLKTLSTFLTADAGGGGRSGVKKKRTSVAKYFSAQLKQLHSKINQTTSYFVRCIKPNQELTPDNFSEDVVIDQLKSLGVLEALRVSRMGFPKSYSHNLFIERYHCLAWKLLSVASGNKKELCTIIVKESLPRLATISSKEDEKGFQIGETKVFLRQQNSDAIDELRYKILEESSVSIQKAARVKIASSKVNLMRKEAYATKIQAQVRKFQAVRDFDILMLRIHSAIIIQKLRRCVVQRSLFKVLLEQKEAEKRAANEEYRIKMEEKEAAVAAKEAETERLEEEARTAAKQREEQDARIQSQVEQFLHTSDLVVRKYSATLIQKYFRMATQRSRYKSMLKEKEQSKKRAEEVKQKRLHGERSPANERSFYLNIQLQKEASDVSQLTIAPDSFSTEERKLLPAKKPMENGLSGPSVASRAKTHWMGDTGTNGKITSLTPRGMPALKQWKVNGDKTVTGLIFGSTHFKNGETVTTSPIDISKNEIEGWGKGTVVQTVSGSKYYLE